MTSWKFAHMQHAEDSLQWALYKCFNYGMSTCFWTWHRSCLVWSNGTKSCFRIWSLYVIKHAKPDINTSLPWLIMVQIFGLFINITLLCNCIQVFPSSFVVAYIHRASFTWKGKCTKRPMSTFGCTFSAFFGFWVFFLWSPLGSYEKKSCLKKLKVCEVSENPKSSICWEFH